MRGRALPYGRLLQYSTSDRWYWEYYSVEQKRNLRKSTRSRDQSVAHKIAQRWATQYLALRERLIPGQADCSTLGQAARDYYQICIGRLNKNYLRMVAQYIDKYLFPYFKEETTLSDLNSHWITEFGTWLGGRELAPQTANKIISCLSAILKYAARSGWIQSVPYIRRLVERRAEHGYELSDQEIAALWAVAVDSHEYQKRFIGFCLFCGMRHGEALRIRWEDIDWQREIIHVVQKNQSDMPAPLGRMREILEPVMENDRHGWVITRCGKPMVSMKRMWVRLKRRAGLPDRVRIHDLRHTFVSRMFRLLGYDARFLSRHKSQDAFLRYLHADREKLYKRANEAF